MAKVLFLINVSLLIINLVSFLIFFVFGLFTQIILGITQLIIMLSIPGIFRTDFSGIKKGYWTYWIMVACYLAISLIVYLIIDIHSLHEIGLMILGIVFILLLPLIIATHSVYLTYRLWDLADKRREVELTGDGDASV